MANDYVAVADLVAFACGLGHNELMEVKASAPLMAALPAIQSSDGISHKYTKLTQLPVVGFRSENDGREVDHSENTTVTETLKILDWSFDIDKAVADSRGRDRVLARQQVEHLKAALYQMEQQTIRGTNNSASGFNGWEDSSDLDAAADEMVVDAGGTTASTGSSVYLIRAGEMECASVYQGDTLDDTAMGDTSVIQKAGSTGFYPAYYTPGCGNFATQIGTKYSIARIASITEDSGATLDDDLIFSAWKLFPAGVNPTHIVMNPRSAEQLRSSRTATNVTGAPAPPVTEVNGIPVIVTDAISNTETLL